MTTEQPTSEELWAEFHRTRSKQARNAIAEKYTDLVEVIARKLIGRCRSVVDLGDLISWGTMGLMQAADRFDPSKGVKFSTYATRRIRGEMLDQMREHSRLPRLLQSRVDMVEEFRDQYRVIHGRGASDDEVLDRFGERVVRAVEEAKELRSIHTIASTGKAAELLPAGEAVVDRREVDPAIKAQGRDLMDYAVRNFKLTEAVALRCYIYDGMSMRDIAEEVLGNSESRVSQIMSSVFRRLREVA